MKYAYRVMMTELCVIPQFVSIQKGCTQGFSEAPELVDDILYDTVDDATESLSRYHSIATGIIMDRFMKKTRGVREFYIEKIKVGEYDRKLVTYGAVRYAEFEAFSEAIPPICPLPPRPIKRRRRRKKCA